ncbi:MAG TPA: formate dehydrogenase subunit alpha [Holophagaceae bacterium]|nr:formate dehydrogenase subunit alpha [Holophagaceae bacterium]
MVRLLLNGTPVDAPEGATLLQALRAHGLNVPTLCHDARMQPASACRLCEVEVEGQERPVCACATPVAEGLSVRTHGEALEDYRKGLVEMLARRYPAEIPALDPDHPFHRLLLHYQVPATGPWVPSKLDESHPYLRLDMNRCVDCYRCVHICEEVQGHSIWKVVGRGAEAHVEPGDAGRLLDSPCVSCGACADTCPTGAIQDWARYRHGTPLTWTRSVCSYCGTGCELEIGSISDRLVDIRPAKDAPVNRGHLCVKGRFGLGFNEADDRVTSPMIRRGGEWEAVSWDEALDEAAALLLRVKEQHGPTAIGVLGSSRGTNEEAFLTQKLARVGLGTGNVDCCARVCHAPSAAGLGLALGTGAATNSFADIDRAGLVMVVGANPTENHPIVGLRIKHRALKGMPLIVIDPRRTELAELATVHLRPRPGTNIPLFQALAHVIVNEGIFDAAFVGARTEGFDAYKASLQEWTPERAAETCGVNAEDIRRAARLYATTAPAYMCNGLGVTEQVQGSDGILALVHLALLTGNLGKPGSGVNPLRGQNNVQGCAQMGCEPKRLTGYQPYDQVIAKHEAMWGPLPPPGLDLLEMLDAAGEGKLRAMLVFGYDLYLTTANAHRNAAALAQLEGMVVVDLFMTETAKAFGTVFLPAASTFEKEGTFMNGERRVQRVRAAIAPRGQSRSDLDILLELAKRLGVGDQFQYHSPEDVWNEVRKLWTAVAGVAYHRLEHPGGLQWPCPDELHPGTAILHTKTFPVGDRAQFRPIAFRPSAEETDTAFPLILNTGRSLQHFNAGTMTVRTENTKLTRDDVLELNPVDAVALGILDDELVTVESRHGAFEAHAHLTERVRPGEPFGIFHSAKAFVNKAMGPGRDPKTHTPEFKRTAVRISKAARG